MHTRGAALDLKLRVWREPWYNYFGPRVLEALVEGDLLEVLEDLADDAREVLFTEIVGDPPPRRFFRS